LEGFHFDFLSNEYKKFRGGHCTAAEAASGVPISQVAGMLALGNDPGKARVNVTNYFKMFEYYVPTKYVGLEAIIANKI
jgi:hypothetical protein